MNERTQKSRRRSKRALRFREIAAMASEKSGKHAKTVNDCDLCVISKGNCEYKESEKWRVMEGSRGRAFWLMMIGGSSVGCLNRLIPTIPFSVYKLASYIITELAIYIGLCK